MIDFTSGGATTNMGISVGCYVKAVPLVFFRFDENEIFGDGSLDFTPGANTLRQAFEVMPTLCCPGTGCFIDFKGHNPS